MQNHETSNVEGLIAITYHKGKRRFVFVGSKTQKREK